MTLKKKYALGNLVLPSNILYAPLAGCSDFAFRKMSSRFTPGLIFCEMVKMDALVRNDRGTFEMLKFSEDMHPIGGQLCGSKPEIAANSARILEGLGFDVIDLNCGCPVDKVTKDGSGSGLLKNPEKIGEIISNIVAAVKVPVTVKIRIGWDEAHINAAEVTAIAEAAGAVSICIHGRTREQAYRGPARWGPIKECKAAANKIKVVANGDIFSPEDAERCFKETGADALLIARGTMGNPWIAEQIIDHLEKRPYKIRTSQESCLALQEHINEIKKEKTEKGVILDTRRISGWYIKGIPNAGEVRNALCHAESVSEIDAILDTLLTTLFTTP